MQSNKLEKSQNTKVNIGKKHLKPKKPLLTRQAEEWCSLLKYALMKGKMVQNEDMTEKKLETSNWMNQVINKEREKIIWILNIDKNLKNRSIVWDFEACEIKEWWKDKLLVRFKTKYWLDVKLDATTSDLNRFLDYCSMHSFIPMFNRIIINGEDILKIPGIYTVLCSKISSKNWTILNSLYNELSKEYEARPDIKQALETILPWINKFLEYRDSIYQYLFGEKLPKVKQSGSISERVFSEAATRIEDDVIKNIWICSTGAKICSYDDDHGSEWDLYFKYRKIPQHHNIREILTQLTMIDDENKLAQKEEKVEGYLHMRPISDIDYQDSTDRHNYILLSINWEFENKAKDVTEWYKKWRDSPSEREKSWKISYFVDTLDPEIIRPAEVIFIALNMLYKKINFKFSDNEEYLKVCNKTGIIYENNQNEINWIKLNKISIDSAEVTKLKYTWGHPNWHDLLKHKYTISYDWIKMWTIVVYWI